MDSKKVVIIADALDFQYAGIKVYLEGMVNALQATSRRHDYILLRAENDFRDLAGQVYVKSYASKFLHPKSRLLLEIPEAIKKIKPDVVVEPCHFGPFRLSPKVKKVTFIHDITPVIHSHFHPSNSALLHKLLLPGIVKRANLVVTNSECTKNDLIKQYIYAKGKTEVVYPGVGSTSTDGAAPIANIDINHEEYILHVGTIEPRKNLVFLIEAFDEIKKRRPDIKLVISGKEGWKNKVFKERLKKSEHAADIIITGYLEKNQIQNLYNHASCMLFTSHYEGFGIPLLEAMAAGCPIITSKNSAQEEVCGHAAVYIEDFVASDWSNAFIALLENKSLREEMIDRGLHRAKYFSWNKSADIFDRLITNIYELKPK